MMLCLCFSAAMLACKKNKTDVPPVQEKSVYILTNEQSSSNNTVAKVFKNGTLVSTIGDGSTVKIYGHDMEVVGNDIYVLAYKFIPATSTQATIIFKNGTEIQTVSTSSAFSPNCLAVSGNDIYACGVSPAPSGGYGAFIRLWKNGVFTDITNGMNSDSRAWDMVVNGNDVFIAGYLQTVSTNNDRKACYWKNGTLTYFDNSTSNTGSQAHRIVVAGNDVYASGYINNKAAFWKNNTITELSASNGYSYGIAVNGADVYTTAGIQQSNNNYRSSFFKNGTITQLSAATNYSSSAFGIGVIGNDVYVIGGVQAVNGGSMQAVYWKNGTESVLATNNYAEAYRIVIQ